MKIIVTSDTHMPKKGTQLPFRLMKELETAELIIHAGDWSSMRVYDTLQQYAPVKGVCGNIESNEILKKLPSKELLTINGFRIGIVHGHGEKKTTERRAFDTFFDEDANAIIFGHSHIPLLRYFKKTLLLNPGSPTDKRTQPYYSFATLQIDDEINTEFIFF
ncbi:metallophosphoesterase family protein [Virgibacillus siamensis]|uniref:Phosphoesterase n=1 Tax=Virgibacillus siamensis TaxID=480071 RepID=A0ABP3RJ56_9BACI